MSGGIAQLVAIGAQDAHLVGQPEVSFFRSNYKRHTNFAQTVERQVIQGNPTAGGMSTVRFERKGDMLGYVYIANRNPDGIDWTDRISKVELLIGGQVIDEHTDEFSRELFKKVGNQTFTKHLYDHANNRFYPLRFSFCENAQSALPLVALQYHDVELRITWGSTATADAEVYAQFIHLDTDERSALSSTPQNMLITQTQKVISSNSRIQELPFNHPIKYLVAKSSTNMSDLTPANLTKLKLQINGVDVTDFKNVVPHFTNAMSFYHVDYTVMDTEFLKIPFCLNTAKLQPTGSLNFSRLDSARLVSDNKNFDKTVYAVNYNILRIENGMGGLMYSN
jgi:hypothetical protein